MPYRFRDFRRARLWPVFLLAGLAGASGFQRPDMPERPNFDKRAQAGAAAKAADADYRAAVAQLRTKVPDVKLDLDPVIGTPKWVATPHGFLSGRNGIGRGISPASLAGIAANDPHRATKAFLREHSALFGYGPEALAGARIKREFTGSHNGLRTVVWQQHLDDIDVFDGVLISHTTRNDELVNLASQFIANPDQAANRGQANRAALQAAPAISARQAIANAAQNLGENLGPYQLTEVEAPPQGAEKRQRFRAAAALNGDAQARLVWLPMNAVSMRLCWEVVLTIRTRGEMFRTLIDAATGEAHLRHCLTAYISPATYRVFTSDSPSPFSPGHATPSTNQPPLVPRSLLTLDALHTNASPAGWIADGENETRGNNVDAHLDVNNDDSPDLPRPHGSPFRVFDFPMTLETGSPFSYSDAAVVQLFYLNNWMHDRLYELGFTEAAGNFQADNFGRGGLGNDAVQADAQDGGGVNNANMSTPPDGSSPRMQMYLFDGPRPIRDGDLDAEIVLHEYTHGLSNRRVGGGVGIYELQTAGMGEGWSDFYGITLLAAAGDDLDGNWAAGGYATYQFFGLTENYYFGIRRYPYSTDMTKNPLTFKDIDPGQASTHPGVPISPISSGGDPGEVHNQGEVWCVTLWGVRANLVRKHGFSVGNQLTLQLVTDGMNLSPVNPNFLEARDAILQADEVLTGGANRRELWAGFARRGMGLSALSPASSTTSGVREAFDVPDDLAISPASGFSARGPVGGAFTPGTQTFSVTNHSTNTIVWSAGKTATWLTLSNAGGTLTPGAPAVTLTVSISATAFFLGAGVYLDNLTFSNHVSGVTQTRQIVLSIGQPDYLTEQFGSGEIDLDHQTLTFTPDGSASFYSVCREPAAAFPTSPRRGKVVYLGSGGYIPITLAGTARVSLFGKATNVFFIGSSGNVTFDSGDNSVIPTLVTHFSLPRIAGLFANLGPGNNGAVSWEQLPDRVAVTYQNVVYNDTNLNNFQIEMFYDGRLRLTHLDIGARDGLAGLSRGRGVPAGFLESDLNAYEVCAPRLAISVPPEATEGNGTLAGLGRVTLPAPVAVDITVSLTSSDPGEVAVPVSVVVPAGQTNASFDLFIADDGDLDGSQNAVITASAPQYNSGSDAIVVHDNEAGALTVTLPASVAENVGSVQGIVSVNAPVIGVLVVGLSSSAPSLLDVPPLVLIPDGTNAAAFTATVLDDTKINGVRSAQITAHVQNWTDGTRSIDVLDNENLNFTVTLPAEASEAGGLSPGAGHVSLSGTLASNLVVALTSSDPTELAVPPTAVILAGQTSAAFDLTLVDDGLLDGDQSVTVTAHAAAFTDGSATMTVTDDETPSVPGNPRPLDLSSNVALSVDLAWSGGENELIVNGDFEAGNLTGWIEQSLGSGRFLINDGFVDPDSPDGPLPPFAGRFNAFSDQVGGGRHAIYQELRIPGNAASATLRWAHRIRNHASVFSDGQRFRVEIRGLDDSVLAVAYSTQPGDPLLQDWVERSFDLSGFRGQTIRVAFAEQDALYYFNAHVDNVSVTVTSPNPTLFDVYFGTNPSPGLAQQVGTTTSNLWHLPPLAPLTTYYWQVVARRVGQAASPVWRFSTRGVDYFAWSPVAATQHVGVPFAATVTARDELDGVVSNFTGTVSFSVAPAAGPSAYTLLGSTVPASSGGGSYTLGYSFTPEMDLIVTHLRHYSGRKVSLWTEEGTVLVSLNIDDSSGSWSETALPSPVQLLAGQAYRLGFFTGGDSWFTGDALPHSFPHGFITQSFERSGDEFPTEPNGLQWVLVDLRYKVGTVLSAPISPAVSGDFVNGAWTGNLAALATASNVVLRAEDGSGHAGFSSPFSVRGAAGAIDSFEWSAIASPQIVNVPFAATLTARDSFGSVVSNYNGSPNVRARRDVTPISIGGGTARSPYPLATFSQLARSQVIYLSGELGPARRLGGLSLNVAAPPGQSLNNWTIRMRHTLLNSYGANPGWESTDWTTVFEGNPSLPAPGWAAFTFNEPFDYDGQRNVMVDFSFYNDSFTFDGECLVTATPAPRSINYGDDGNFGDPLFWSGVFPLPEIRNEMPNLQLHPFNPTVAVTPPAAAPFVNGVWNGSLAVAEPAADLRLDAYDANGHSGRSSAFTVGVQDDIAVSVFASPTLVAVGDTLTYAIRVTNTGPASATGVMLTNVLPGGISMVSVTPSQGSCATAVGIVRCNLGTLGASSQAVVTVTCLPTGAVEMLVDRASVGRTEPDFYLPNNSATNAVTARVRFLDVDNAFVLEGNSGVTNAVFALRLSVPSAQPMTVSFATSNGTATAGVDYRATNGSIVFSPGQTEKSISVAVLGDTVYEDEEEFLLNLSVPPNFNVTYNNGVGYISNDDDPPLVFLRDTSVVEGQSGTTNAVFRLELSAMSGSAVTVYYGTSDDSAQAGADYVGTNSFVVIPAGRTNTNIVVIVIGDSVPEPDEAFHVNLNSISGASYGNSQATGTIVSDDLRPLLVADLATLVADANSNGVIDPGETVTVSMALRNTGIANTTNLVASLLSTGGVTVPGGPQTYGVVTFGGSPVARPFTFTAAGTNGGTISATLQLQDGGANLGTVTFNLNIGLVKEFRIVNLGTDGCQAIEHNGITGDDRGGIAASSSQVFYTGDNVTGRFALGDLSGGTGVGRQYEALTSDLRTETLYTLGFGSQPISAGGTVNTLLEIDGNTGALTARSVSLSASIAMSTGSGIFAGYGRVVLHNGARVYSIALPSGTVTDLGAMVMPTHNGCESWAFWGVAEDIGGATWLAYVRDSANIAHARVPDGQVNVVAAFSSLSDMCSFTVSLARNRWYFHHEGTSQFRSGDETIGFCNATFSITTEPRLDHFEWSTIPAARPWNTPFPVTVTARDSLNRTLDSFTGSVAIAAVRSSPASSRTILSSPVHNSPTFSGVFTLGYSFTPNTNLTVTHVRHYGGTKVSIWTDTGALLASQLVSSPGGTWRETPLPAPLSLAAGTRYRVAIFTGGSNYYWRTDLTSTFADGVINQSYQIGGDNFPNTIDNERWWFVDLRYVTGATVTVPIIPVVSGHFVNGAWNGSVTVQETGTNLVLRADDGAGHAGTSTPFRVVTNSVGTLDHFAWNLIGATQFTGAPFPVTITARDELDNAVPGFSGQVALSATGLMAASFTLRGSPDPEQTFNAGNFTLGYEFTPSTDLVVTHLRHYSATKVSIWTEDGAVLFSQVVPASGGSWSETPVAAPFTLTNGHPYRVGFLSGGNPYYWRSENATSFSHGNLTGSFYAGGDHFPDNPFSDGWWLVDLRFDSVGLAPVGLFPPNSGSFVNGAWSGALTVTQSVANLIVRADDNAGHTGESNPFRVLALRPALSITRDHNLAVISWTPFSPGFGLESSPTLEGTNAWLSMTNAVFVNGGVHTVTNTIAGGREFYRLRGP